MWFFCEFFQMTANLQKISQYIYWEKSMYKFWFNLIHVVQIHVAKSHMYVGVPIMAQQLTNLTSIHEDAGLIPGLAQWVKDMALPWAVVWVTDTARIPCCYLWLFCRPAATAPIGSLAWELPYAMGAALKRQRKTKKKVNRMYVHLYLCVCVCVCVCVWNNHKLYTREKRKKRIFLLLLWHMEVPRLGVCLIGAIATSLRQSHSNTGSEPRLQPNENKCSFSQMMRKWY